MTIELRLGAAMTWFGWLARFAAVVVLCACYGSSPADPPADDEGAPPRAAGESRRVALALGEPITVSHRTWQAGPPAVRFLQGAWWFAWTALEPHGRYSLASASIRPGSHMLWTNSAETLLGRWPQLTFDAQGRLSAVYGGSTCEHQIYSQTYLQPAAPKLSLPCGGDDHFAEATPQPDGESWLIVYGSESTVDSPGTLTVGSYDPFSASWTLSPRTFGARESYDGGAVLATDDRAYVVWGHGDRSTLGSFELQDGSPLTTIELERSAIYTESFALERLGDRTLIAGLDERGLWTASTDASELIAQSQIERAIVSDRRPNMVAAPGLGLVGVCYGVSGSGVAAAGGSGPYDEVAFVLLDRDAAPVAAPRVIRRMQNFGGCDVAWSGEEFLVAYWTIELPNSGRLEDGFESVVVGQPIRVSIEAGHRE